MIIIIKIQNSSGKMYYKYLFLKYYPSLSSINPISSKIVPIQLAKRTNQVFCKNERKDLWDRHQGESFVEVLSFARFCWVHPSGFLFKVLRLLPFKRCAANIRTCTIARISRGMY